MIIEKVERIGNGEHTISINGCYDERSYSSALGNGEFVAFVFEKETISEIQAQRFLDVKNHFVGLSCYVQGFDFWGNKLFVEFEFNE